MDIPAPLQVNRSPQAMTTDEVTASCRLARLLADYQPSAYLAKALASWLFTAERELARREGGTDT